jgi:hypothetical protein
MPAS